jgi:hypothetical protein
VPANEGGRGGPPYFCRLPSVFMIGFSRLYGLTGAGFFNNLQGTSNSTTPIIF